MRWPIWSQTTEEQKPMWNAELVANLEAERVKGLPRRPPITDITDTPEEIQKRRRLAAEIARSRAHGVV